MLAHILSRKAKIALAMPQWLIHVEAARVQRNADQWICIELRPILEIRCWLNGIHQEAGYYVCCEGKPLWIGRLLAVGGWMRWKIGAVYCEFMDHKMVDDSHAGPESGSMAGHCERCGWSFHTTLY